MGKLRLWRDVMCTAISISGSDHYFGRTLDLEGTYGEEVVLTPRRYPLPFRHLATLENHPGIIGMAHIFKDYPLYYDAMNEAGLCMAALNFPGYAHYGNPSDEGVSVASFELLPLVLAQCKTVEEALPLLTRLRVTSDCADRRLPPTDLHWMLADKSRCIVLEPMKDGLRIYDNPVGVLTNAPPFDAQMLHLSNYMHLSPNAPHNRFSDKITLRPFSRGMGAMGLPGDLSSQSRFVRAAFTKLNSRCDEGQHVSQFFHILETVSQPRGACRLENGSSVITQYTSCCDVSSGSYCYTTYRNRRITAVQMRQDYLDSCRLYRRPISAQEDIAYAELRGD